MNTVFRRLLFFSFIFVGPLGLAKTPSAASAMEFRCKTDALEQSECMIRAVLKDMLATYKLRGGGGISEIKQPHDLL